MSHVFELISKSFYAQDVLCLWRIVKWLHFFQVFYSEKYLKEHPSPEERMLITRLKQYTTSQVVIHIF